MRELLLVALGGAAGSVARVVTSGVVYRLLPVTYPWGTTVVNIAGSLLFGMAVGVGITRGGMSPDARALVLSGLLGGFTTFSAFSFETVELMATGYIARALVNIVSQVSLGAAALWLGMTLVRT